MTKENTETDDKPSERNFNGKYAGYRYRIRYEMGVKK